MIITHARQISLLVFIFFVWPFAQETNTSSHQKVFGEYCFAQELSKGKIVWKWKKYKENWKYLFSYIPCAFQGMYSINNNTNGGSLFGLVLNTSTFNDKEPSKCSTEHFDSREYIVLDEVQESADTELPKLNKIKNAYYDVNWEINYDSNYVRLHHSGSTKIYISGFCTEEQLKAIRERKKQELKENKANKKSTP